MKTENNNTWIKQLQRAVLPLIGKTRNRNLSIFLIFITRHPFAAASLLHSLAFFGQTIWRLELILHPLRLFTSWLMNKKIVLNLIPYMSRLWFILYFPSPTPLQTPFVLMFLFAYKTNTVESSVTSNDKIKERFSKQVSMRNLSKSIIVENRCHLNLIKQPFWVVLSKLPVNSTISFILLKCYLIQLYIGNILAPPPFCRVPNTQKIK